MGRRATPFTIYADPRTGIAWINARIAGKRTRKSLGLPYAPDVAGGEAHGQRLEQAAREAYAAIVSGRSLDPTQRGRLNTAATLRELLSAFLAEDALAYPASAKLTVTHASHFEAFAEDDPNGRTPLEELTSDAGPTDFVLWRLRRVLKTTVIKEVSTLYRFYAWALKREHIASLPPRPAWPKKAIGVRSGPQRETPVQVTHAQALAIIDAMPEWSARGRSARKIPVRDLARLAYETGLRPSTIARLSCPEHYSPGANRIWVPPDIDKGRNAGRWVPLTTIAQAILSRHAKEGVLFGRHDLRVQWKRAAAKVLPPAVAAKFSIYDFRHAAGRRMVEASGGNLLGAAHMLGHKHLTTTNRYLAPAEHHGEAVVSAMERIKGKRPRPTGIRSAKRSAEKAEENARREK